MKVSFASGICFFAASALLGLPSAVRAQYQPVYARHGMVVAGESRAAQVGVDILKAGGNAYDAAAAVGFALAATLPEAGNLGGGGFAVLLAPDGEPLALDFREVAPAAAHRDMYLDAEGKVIPDASLYSYLAVGVPGTVDGLLRLQERFGRLERADVLSPAVRLAEQGFPVSHWLAERLRTHEDVLKRHPATAEIFFPDGDPLEFGRILRQPDLARTLRRIVAEGRDGFYEGAVAEALASQVQAGGGIITLEDLETYESRWREPVTFGVGDYEIITHPLPSSGGVTLAQILGLLDLEALEEAQWNSAEYIHRVVEAERLAYADRNYHLGDPDFVDVPVAALISEAYLQKRRALVPESVAGESERVSHGSPREIGEGQEGAGAGTGAAAAAGEGREEPEQTTHYCVVDADGNVVSITTTLNASFGMGAIVGGAGFFLNNEMDDFSAKPGVPNLYGLIGAEANAIEPGKRMLSSMTPTIVRRDGEFFMTMGTPGGSTIITTVLQIFLNSALFEMNIADAIAAPRFHHQWLPDVIYHEARAVAPETAEELRAMGYELEEREAIGIAAGIRRQEDGLLAGAADPRGDGAAAGY